VKVAQYEVLGYDAKRRVRPVRDDKNVRFWSRMPLSDFQHWSIVPFGTDSSLRTLTQHFVLGYFREVPAGLIFSNQRWRLRLGWWHTNRRAVVMRFVSMPRTHRTVAATKFRVPHFAFRILYHGYCAPVIPTYTAYNEVVAVMNSRFLFGPPKVKLATGSGILILPNKRPEAE
jgi:hypothetical protein